MQRKYNDNDSSDEEGFQSSEIGIMDIPIQQIAEKIKVGDAKQLIAKKFTYVCFSIYTHIPLIAYPHVLYQNAEDSLIKMDKHKPKEQQKEQPTETKELAEFLKSGNVYCIYNKFDSKLDFKNEMTSFYKSFENQVGPVSSHYKQFTGKDPASNEDIEFSSNFESGNLQFVFASENTYYLLLQNDINTHGFNSWFYFRIRNKRKCKIRLMILNISRPVGLMKNAMGVSVFSVQQRSFCRKYWTEGGTNLQVYKNWYRRKVKNSKHSQYYTLEFDYEFKFESDSVYFALNTPFTYTKLLNSIDDITKYKKENIIINVKVLGKTVSNNTIHALEFTRKHKPILNVESLKISASTVADETTTAEYIKELLESKQILPKKRRSIIFIGRQHPYETNSSYILEGITTFLSEENDTSLFLLENYDIYIIPMVNPDGVVHGHSRTNLCGYDINREWAEPNQEKSKEVYLISEFIKHLNQVTQISYVFDFQSHSKKFNTFGYFCDNSLETKAFAWYLEDTNANFSYSSCTFNRNKGKEKTLRYFTYGLGIKNSITIETSFFGKLEHGLYRRYNTKQLRDIGISIIKAIGEFSEPEVCKVIINNYVKSNVPQGLNEEEFSESEPEGDYLEERQRVRIILSARREIENQKPKGFQKTASFERPKPLQKNLLNKTSVRFSRDNNSKTQSPTFPGLKTRPSFSASPQKGFKPYSQQQMLRDDSQQEISSPKRRIRTQSAHRSPSRIYLWDQNKYSVNKVISYPTTVQPFLNRLSSVEVLGYDNSPIKRRKVSAVKYTMNTEIQLERLILDNRKVEEERNQHREEVKRRMRRGKYFKKLFPNSISTPSQRSAYY